MLGLKIGVNQFKRDPVGYNVRLENYEDILSPEERRKIAIDEYLKKIMPVEIPTPTPRPNRECFLAGTLIDMWDGSRKPIEEIEADDVVVSYYADGALKPGRVSRTFRNRAKRILDVHGLMMTPGHVTFCARVEGEDNPFAGTHVPVIDILRSDGALMTRDGALIRAATGCEVGSQADRRIPAIVTREIPGSDDDIVVEEGYVRLGTGFVAPDGRSITVDEIIARIGGAVADNGLVLLPDGTLHPFVWTLSDALPRPEDYVLQRSVLTLNDIYAAGEWEAMRPRMPAPVSGEAGPAFVDEPGVLHAGNTGIARPSAGIEANIPLSAHSRPDRPKLSRKQRRAMEARARKQKQPQSVH